MRDGYFTINQAAAYLAVSRSTIYRWLDSGKLSAVRIGGRSQRIPLRELRKVVSPETNEERDEQQG